MNFVALALSPSVASDLATPRFLEPTMSESTRSPLGVCVLPSGKTTRYPDYIHEILAHAGICYQRIALAHLTDVLPKLEVLVTVGDSKLTDDAASALESWVRAGGAWLAVGGVCEMPGLFGVEVEEAAYCSWGGGAGTLGEGYIRARDTEHPILAHLRIPLHFFNGTPVRAAGARVLAEVLDAHQRSTDRAAVLESRADAGRCVLICPDLTGTVVHIQQGFCVTRDGVPAPDGTAPINDDTLKTDDGAVLDWIFDRWPIDGGSGLSGFLEPIADQWRELFLRALFHLCAESGASLPLLWLYPRNLPTLGHISHDTDISEVPNAYRLIEVLAEARIHSTWCVIQPAYPPEVISAIRAAGHELAVHYDAMSKGCEWGEPEFRATIDELAALFGEKPTTNKNHYLRWEGDTEFFGWCVRAGITLDESKGPSKSGNVGFGFGTCHPHFPIDPSGRPIDVLELPTLTQDLMIVAPRELSAHLIDGAARCHGIAHLLFHPAHILKDGVADALLETIAQGRNAGMEWWTAREIGKWERARRSASWVSCQDGSATLSTGEALPEATILWLAEPNSAVSVDGVTCGPLIVERWGQRFAAVIANLAPNTQYAIHTTQSL